MTDVTEKELENKSPGLHEDDLLPIGSDKERDADNPMRTVGSFLGAGLTLGAINTVTATAGNAGAAVDNFFGGEPHEVAGSLNGGAVPAAMTETPGPGLDQNLTVTGPRLPTPGMGMG